MAFLQVISKNILMSFVIDSIADSGNLSKYPPVKLVALNYGPLKAVCLKDQLTTIWWSIVKIISVVQHDDLLFLDHEYMLE